MNTGFPTRASSSQSCQFFCIFQCFSLAVSGQHAATGEGKPLQQCTYPERWCLVVMHLSLNKNRHNEPRRRKQTPQTEYGRSHTTSHGAIHSHRHTQLQSESPKRSFLKIEFVSLKWRNGVLLVSQSTRILRPEVGKLRGPSAVCVDAVLETNLEAANFGI